MGRIIVLRLLDSYFRHRWLYLLPVVIMTIFAVLYFLTQERLYISSGVLYTDQTSLLSSLTSVQTEGFSWNTPAQDTTNQISDLIRTDAFIRAIIQNTDLEAEMSKGESAAAEAIIEVRKRIWASVAGVNQVQISAANASPIIARQLAQSTIATFVQWKINLDRTDSVTAGIFFQDLIQVYKSDVVEAQQALKGYLETHPEPFRDSRPDTEELEIQNLQSELTFAGTRLAQALDKAEDARLAETQVESNIHQQYTIVDTPKLPDKPAISRRQMAMNAAVFLVVGVFLSGIAVVGATVFERSFRIPVDVRQMLNLPVLAIIPNVSVPTQKKRPRERKKKEAFPTENPEPITEKPVVTLIATGFQEDQPAPIKQKRPWGRPRKVLMPAESRNFTAEWLEETPVVVGHQEDVAVPIMPKRPRGRPRKVPVSVQSYESLAEEPEETSIEVDLHLGLDLQSEQTAEK